MCVYKFAFIHMHALIYICMLSYMYICICHYVETVVLYGEDWFLALFGVGGPYLLCCVLSSSSLSH